MRLSGDELESGAVRSLNLEAENSDEALILLTMRLVLQHVGVRPFVDALLSLGKSMEDSRAKDPDASL